MMLSELNQHLEMLERNIMIPIFPGVDKSQKAGEIRANMVARVNRIDTIVAGIKKDLKSNKFQNLKPQMVKVQDEVKQFLSMFK